jgi:hypothetical protein
LAVPGGLAGARPGGSAIRVPEGKGASIRVPERPDTLGSLGDISSLVKAGVGIADDLKEKPKAAVSPEATAATADQFKPEVARRLSDKPLTREDADILKALGNAEIELNQLRASNPALAAEFQQPVFDAILEATRRIKLGQPLRQGAI